MRSAGCKSRTDDGALDLHCRLHGLIPELRWLFQRFLRAAAELRPRFATWSAYISSGDCAPRSPAVDSLKRRHYRHGPSILCPCMRWQHFIDPDPAQPSHTAAQSHVAHELGQCIPAPLGPNPSKAGRADSPPQPRTWTGIVVMACWRRARPWLPPWPLMDVTIWALVMPSPS
jgi:hypothetical protein